MNVTVMTTTAMRMQTALTQREVSLATVTLATLGMGSTVRVSTNGNIQTCIIMHSLLYFLPPDFDECQMETYPCNASSNCTDTIGSFTCTCIDGFEGDGFNCIGIKYLTLALKTDFLKSIVGLMCRATILCLDTDIHECNRGLDDCNMNATCVNTVGSYDCMCNTGFTGNGFTCTGMQTQIQ